MSNVTNKSDVIRLAEALDGTLRQKAEAIEAFVDSRTTTAIGQLRQELAGLVGRQADNIEKAKTDGSAEAKASANQATKAVKAADTAVNAAVADPTTPEKAKVAETKVQEAVKAVDKTESDLAARMGAAEGRIDNHEQRIKALEKGQSGIVANLDQVWMTVRAHATAIATGNGATTGLRRLGRMALATFVVVVAIWFLLVLVTPVTLASWNIGVGLAAVAAGLVFAIGLTRMEDDVPATASAEADAGVEIMSDQREHSSH